VLDAVSELACSQHAVRQFLDAGLAKIELSRTDELLDRDFVLRWRLAQDELTPSLVYYQRADGDVYGLLSVLAPRGNGASEGQSRDVVFVLDRSGSMGGPKMASAARACGCLLRTLGPADRFGIVAFDNRLEWCEKDGTGPQLLVADEDGLGRGERWLRGIEASGGTDLAPALAAAVDLLKQRAGGAARTPVVLLIFGGRATSVSFRARLQDPVRLRGTRAAVLGQLEGLKEAFAQLKKGVQALTQSSQTRRRPRPQRFWDRSV
jgi:Ca-activated chloride channel family protein